MTDERPDATLVSVVIPCYNYGRYLGACVDSVLRQGVDVQVVIIDDASQDDSLAVARSLADRDDRIEVVHHTRNRGHIATYNEGLLERARGDYLVLLSADDRLTDGSLERSLAVMEANPDVGMVYGRAIEFVEDDDLRDVSIGRDRGAVVWSRQRWLARRCREAVNVVPNPGVVVRADVHRKVGGYDPGLPHAGDFEMWLRIATVADVGFIRGAAQAYYRVHPASMSQAVYKNNLADVRERGAVFDKLLAEHSTEVRAAGVLPRQPYRALASEPLWWACRAYEKGDPDLQEVAEAEQLARRMCADVTRLPAYRALCRRRRVGALVSHRTHMFVGTAAARRVRKAAWWKMWAHRGG